MKENILSIKSDLLNLKSKLNSNILYPVYQGPRRVRIMKKNRVRKSRDTLPLINKEAIWDRMVKIIGAL